MKLLFTFRKTPPTPPQFGLSEDDTHYCLVKNDGGKFSPFWQKKPCELADFLHRTLSEMGYSLPTSKTGVAQFTIIRPISHDYLWRKVLFLPNSLTKEQLHQHIIHILKNEQPLNLEQLYFDYLKFAIKNQDLAKIIIYAIHKQYADQFLLCSNMVLDCDLYCYVRSLVYFETFKKAEIKPFIFNHKTVQFSEEAILFNQIEKEKCIKIDEILIDEPSIDSAEKRHLYLLALGASLWNGKASI